MKWHVFTRKYPWRADVVIEAPTEKDAKYMGLDRWGSLIEMKDISAHPTWECEYRYDCNTSEGG